MPCQTPWWRRQGETPEMSVPCLFPMLEKGTVDANALSVSKEGKTCGGGEYNPPYYNRVSEKICAKLRQNGLFAKCFADFQCISLGEVWLRPYFFCCFAFFI